MSPVMSGGFAPTSVGSTVRDASREGLRHVP